MSAHSRFAWIDNLRTLLIILVVNIHACVTYGHVGGWYFQEKPEPPMRIKLLFLFWEAHIQSFFMGLLFLIAGYFAEASAQRKEPATFIKDRFFRLGIPLLLYIFVLHPLMIWGINPREASLPTLSEWYFNFLRTGSFLRATGPLWFAEALLIFSLAFIFWRVRWGMDAGEAGRPQRVQVRARFVILLMAGTGLASFVVRLIQPIGTSVLNLQLCFFPQYLVAFALGVWLGRRRALNDVAQAPEARRMAWVTVLASPLILLALILPMRNFSGSGEPPLFGGMNPFAFGFAGWEQFAGVGLSAGLLVFAQAKMNEANALSRWMSDRSFAVYVFHAPILLAFTTAIRGLSENPFLMTALATLVTLTMSFIAADLLRKLPGLKRLF